MSTLKELIDLHCPDGVETISLGDLEDNGRIKLGRGKVISKVDIANCPGEFPIYSSSAARNGVFGSYGKYLFDDERITWSVDGGGRFFYRPEHRYSVTNVCGWLKVLDSTISTKFLFYYLEEAWTYERFDYTRKAHPSVIRPLYLIPLPPREVQDKIVEALETFSALCDNLDMEIAQREQQLEAFRHQMVHTVEQSAYDFVPLNEVAEITTGKTPSTKNDSLWGGSIPFVTPTDFGRGFDQNGHTERQISEACVAKMGRNIVAKDSVLVTCIGASIGTVGFVREMCLTNQQINAISAHDNLSPRFVYHLMKERLNFLKRLGGIGTMPIINKTTFGSITIPLPPLDVQRDIVDKLDAMQDLIGNLKLEREQRGQQFEYYRAQLLTFPAKDVSFDD